MTTTLMEATACPVCMYKLNAATALDGMAAPTEGDVTLCINCASILEFGDELQLLVATQKTLNDLPDETIEELQNLQRQLIRLSPGSTHFGGVQ